MAARMAVTMTIVLFSMLLTIPLHAVGATLLEEAEAGNINGIRDILAADPTSLNQADEVTGRTALHLAAAKGHLEVVRLLLDRGAAINVPESTYQLTPLHMACQGGHPEVVGLLLDKGADLHAREKDNETAIYYAAQNGSLDLLKLLVSRGAEVMDRQSTASNTPLRLAVLNGKTDAARFLIDRGEDPLAKGNKGHTLLHEASFGSPGTMIDMLVKEGIPVDSAKESGETALHFACMAGNMEAIKALVRNGANLESQWNGHGTAINIAVSRGNNDLVLYLIEAGARIDKPSPTNGRNLLHEAVIRGNVTLANLLLKKGLDPSRRDWDNKTALDYARYHGHTTIVRLLSGSSQGTFLTADYLREKLAQGQAQIIYLNHSGWAIRTATHFLVFDYWPRPYRAEEPSLGNGILVPEEIKDLDVVFFVSHNHRDHYNPEIFSWRNVIKRFTVILGFEPNDQSGYTFMPPRQTRRFGAMEVTTIAANDSGVGFLVNVDGVSLFHMGDHANRKRDFSEPFREEIEFLVARGARPDLLFTPISGCGFGDQEAVKLGVYLTTELLKPRWLLPMHAGGSEDRCVMFAEEARQKHIAAPLMVPRNPGDRFFLNSSDVSRLDIVPRHP